MIPHVLRRCSALLCVLGILLWCAAGTLLYVSAEGSGSLTLVSVKDDVIISDMEWNLYYVGNLQSVGDPPEEKFVFAAPFDGYHVSVGDMSASALTDLAGTLDVYVRLDHAAPLQSGRTDKNGRITFPDLQEGMYLLSPTPMAAEPYSLDSDPIIVSLDGKTNYLYDAYPKIRFDTLDGSEVDYTVKKVWANDETQPWRRSTFITVELYCDGTLNRTVTLNEANDWTYEWTSDNTKKWLIKEKVVPPNYVVTYRSNVAQYIIVNTFENPEGDSSFTDVPRETNDDSFTEAVGTSMSDSVFTDGTGESRSAQTDVVPPSTRSSEDRSVGTDATAATAARATEESDAVPQESGSIEGSSPSSGVPSPNASDETPPAVPPRASDVQEIEHISPLTEVTDTTSSTDTTTTAVVSSGSDSTEKLPQTGQLWWPVPVLAAGGLIFLGAGLCIGRKGKE
ncbi:MAG: Cna B-type domain-containing protein [Oscillospiraceae bacterium]|nr:Cna B-type domain-containing protein [Oscillospiraceae bacterium]